jgi:hypothetical protein
MSLSFFSGAILLVFILSALIIGPSWSREKSDAIILELMLSSSTARLFQQAGFFVAIPLCKTRRSPLTNPWGKKGNRSLSILPQ